MSRGPPGRMSLPPGRMSPARGLPVECRDSGSNVVQAFRPATPVLVTQPGASPDEPWWTLRDREEELVAIARQLKADRRRGESVALDRTAIVYKHPLPYLYAASEIFRDAGIPYRMSDTLPLAAEPTSAALDLILDAVSSRFSRATMIALLRSPHFVFRADEDKSEGDGKLDKAEPDELTRESVSALDRALSAARYLGELERLEALAGEWGDWRLASRDGCGARDCPRPRAADRDASCLRAGRLPSRLLVRICPPDCRRGSVRIARAARTFGDRRHAAIAGGGARRTRQSRLDRRRTGHRRAALDRGSDVRPRRRRPQRRAPARRSSRPLRRFRRCGDCRRGRPGLARAAEAQHFLSAGAAQGARLAVREGSARRRRRAVPRPADVGETPDDGVHLHARRRRHRVAFAAARRDSSRPVVDGGARPIRGRAGSLRTKHCRSSRRPSIRFKDTRGAGRSCGPRGRPRMRPTSTVPSAPFRRAPGRSARSKRISIVRSSFSRSTCSSSRRSPTTKR